MWSTLTMMPIPVSNLMSAWFGGTEIAYSCDEDASLSSIIRVKVLSYFLSWLTKLARNSPKDGNMSIIYLEFIMKHDKPLGVTISKDLKWDTHVSNIVKQANISLSMFKLLNKLNRPKIHFLRVYLSFIRPLLEYACPVWHSQLSSELNDKIESVQSVRSGSFTKKAKFHTPSSLKLHTLPP